MRSWVELSSPDPLKPLKNRLGEYWTHYLVARFWRNQLSYLGSPMSLQQGGGLLALMMTPVDPPHTLIFSTAIGSNWCASARAAYLQPLPQMNGTPRVVCSCTSFHCWPIQVHPQKWSNDIWRQKISTHYFVFSHLFSYQLKFERL